MYADGRPDLPKGVNAAIKWYTKSADAGFASAQYNLGSLYAQGDGVAKDFSMAAHWYQRAVKFGHPKAQLDLGSMYAFGIGVDRDLARGLQLLEAAAQTKELAPKAKAHAALACRDRTPSERDLCALHARN